MNIRILRKLRKRFSWKWIPEENHFLLLDNKEKTVFEHQDTEELFGNVITSIFEDSIAATLFSVCYYEIVTDRRDRIHNRKIYNESLKKLNNHGKQKEIIK